MKVYPQSSIIAESTLCNRMTFCVITSLGSISVISDWQSILWHIFESLSTTIKMIMYVFLYSTFFDRPVIKSIEKTSYVFGKTFRGWSFSFCFLQIILFFSQMRTKL